MKYYGIVREIKEEHKSGIYGRRKPTKKESIDIFTDLGIKIDKKYKRYINFIPGINDVKNFYNFIQKIKKQPIIFQVKLPESVHKQLIIKDKLLNKNFSLDDDFSYGLLDDFSLKEKIIFFKTLMTSKGGSSLIILDKNQLPSNLKHYGGENGRFNDGLYVAHPKDDNLLLPLKDFNNLIQTLILEETIRVYEALGAKEISIEDVTEIKNAGEVKKNKVKVDVNTDYKKEVLRLKKFGKGIFDTKRALNDKLFIHDIPAVMSTIDARINGNQILEEFTETINLDIGIDVTVLGFFEVNNNFSYLRKWHFKVVFYDKNDMNKS